MSTMTTQLPSSFANCVMTLYLLKVHLQLFLSVPITQKCQILSCDTLVTKERYVRGIAMQCPSSPLSTRMPTHMHAHIHAHTPHARARTHTHTHTRARARTHTHTHTHTWCTYINVQCCVPNAVGLFYSFNYYTSSLPSQAALAVVLNEQLEGQKAAAASQDPFVSEFGMRLNHLLVRDFIFRSGKQGIPFMPCISPITRT
jgi:hypothetical protein